MWYLDDEEDYTCEAQQEGAATTCSQGGPAEALPTKESLMARQSVCQFCWCWSYDQDEDCLC